MKLGQRREMKSIQLDGNRVQCIGRGNNSPERKITSYWSLRKRHSFQSIFFSCYLDLVNLSVLKFTASILSSALYNWVHLMIYWFWFLYFSLFYISFFKHMFLYWDFLHFHLFQENSYLLIEAFLWSLLYNPCCITSTSHSSQCRCHFIVFSHSSCGFPGS